MKLREGVEQVEVRRGIEQQLMLVLPVQIHQTRGGIAERRRGRERAVQERSAPAALRRQLPADDQLAAVGLFEDRFDRGLVLTRPNELGRGPAADQQADRPHQDGFAGPGLARQHVQPRLELQFETFDDGEITNGQKTEHRPEVPSYQMFDSVYGACYASRNCAVPAAWKWIGRGDATPRTDRIRRLDVENVCRWRAVCACLSSRLRFLRKSAQPEAGTGELARNSDIVRLVADATLVGKVVLLILLIFSAVSWAVIFYKIWAYRRAEQQIVHLPRACSARARSSPRCRRSVPRSAPARWSGSFQSGYAELNTQLRTDKAAEPGKPGGSAGRPTLKSLDAVDRALLRATTVELNKLEHRVPFLATTASITPFIGLFGTVWGIVIAFQGIATAGNTSLGVVAQPIAEALIATAAGLFAAIPAVYFYNHFTNKVKKFASEMDDFSLEFLNISERNFT